MRLSRTIVDLVRKTRTHESVAGGARGLGRRRGLVAASPAHAAIAGRDFVTPDDVKGDGDSGAGSSIDLRPEFEIEGVTAAEAVGKILESVAVPV